MKALKEEKNFKSQRQSRIKKVASQFTAEAVVNQFLLTSHTQSNK